MMQTTIFDAIAQRDRAMRLVSDKAEKHHAGWGDLADAFFALYAMSHQEFFPYELTQAYGKSGNVLPADDRHWGPVFLRAVKAKQIMRGAKVGKHPKRHAVEVRSWVSLVCRGKA